MTRTLILTRHAKSDWDDPTLDDHDRPLNTRGRKASSALGHWMAQAGWKPDQALVSTARRAAETFQGICATSGVSPDARFVSALYHATPDQMLTVLQRAINPVVLLVAHNPGIAEFAARLAETLPEHPRFHDYPTGATTVFHFPQPDWTSVGWREGAVADFVIPRELDQPRA